MSNSNPQRNDEKTQLLRDEGMVSRDDGRGDHADYFSIPAYVENFLVG